MCVCTKKDKSNIFAFFGIRNSKHLSKFLIIRSLRLHRERKWLQHTALMLAASNLKHSLAHYGSWQLSMQAAFITRHLCNGFFFEADRKQVYIKRSPITKLLNRAWNGHVCCGECALHMTTCASPSSQLRLFLSSHLIHYYRWRLCFVGLLFKEA